MHRVARETGDERDAGPSQGGTRSDESGTPPTGGGGCACFTARRASFPSEETVAEESPARPPCTAALRGPAGRGRAALGMRHPKIWLLASRLLRADSSRNGRHRASSEDGRRGPCVREVYANEGCRHHAEESWEERTEARAALGGAGVWESAAASPGPGAASVTERPPPPVFASS